MTAIDVVVLLFGDRRVPRALASFPTVDITAPGDIDEAISQASRVVVLGSDTDLATVLTRLLRTDRLAVEVAYPTGFRGVRRAISGTAQRVPLIRDETGQVIVGYARWQSPADGQPLEGEGIVDDTVLFDGTVAGVRVETLDRLPGLRARAEGPGRRSGRWVSGRAAQLGSPSVMVVRDGVPAPRPVRRSTFYRHIEGWLRVR